MKAVFLVVFSLFIASALAACTIRSSTATINAATTTLRVYQLFPSAVSGGNSISVTVKWEDSLDTNVVRWNVSTCDEAGVLGGFDVAGTETANGFLLGVANISAPTTTAAPNTTATTTRAPVTSTTQSPTITTTNASFRMSPSFFIFALISFVALVLPKNRASLAILLVAAVLVMNANSMTNSSESTLAVSTVNVVVYAPANINRFCTNTTGTEVCFDRTGNSGNITQYVNLQGTRFADLRQGSACAKGSYTVPSGWKFSTDSTKARLVAYLAQFNTNEIIVRSSTNPNLVQALAPRATYGQASTETDSQGFASISDNGNTITIINCDSVILIEQEFPLPEENTGKAVFITNPEITNFKTVNGYDYAVADNTPYAQTTPRECQAKPTYLVNSAWEVAPESNSTYIAITNARYDVFGTDCFAVSTNISFKADESRCNDGSTGVVYTVSYNGGTIWNPNCNSAPRKLLLRRASTAANSWPVVAPGTTGLSNFVNKAGKPYGAIDDYATFQRTPATTDANCQLHYMRPLANYVVATRNETRDFLDFEKYQTWYDVYCWTSDTVSFTHELIYQNVTTTTNTTDPNTNVTTTNTTTTSVSTGEYQQCATNTATRTKVVDGVTYYIPFAGACAKTLIHLP